MRPRNPLEVRDRDALRKCIESAPRVVPHSVRSLAEMAGVSHATIGDLLTGRKTRVTLDLAQRLSAILGRPMGDLFLPTPSELADTDGAQEEGARPNG